MTYKVLKLGINVGLVLEIWSSKPLSSKIPPSFKNLPLSLPQKKNLMPIKIKRHPSGDLKFYGATNKKNEDKQYLLKRFHRIGDFVETLLPTNRDIIEKEPRTDHSVPERKL